MCLRINHENFGEQINALKHVSKLANIEKWIVSL